MRLVDFAAAVQEARTDRMINLRIADLPLRDIVRARHNLTRGEFDNMLGEARQKGLID